MTISEASGTFGALLRQYRLQAGLTQSALADKAGLSARGIQNLELGVSQPYRNTVQQLAAALGLTPEQRANFESAAQPTPRRREGAPSGPHFDVFLSHTGQEESVVERIAEGLRHAGLQPWLDRWYVTPDDSWQERIVVGLRASSSCAVLVGPHGLDEWERQELGLALERRAKDRTFRIFPVLLPGLAEPFDATSLPPPLDTQTWVDLRCGIDHPGAFQRLVNAVNGLPLDPERPGEPRDGTCPYRGLHVFDEGHAEFFFGRDGDIQRLLEKLKATRFLAVVAASGSGKSSIVRAGLVPALRRGGLPDSDTWTISVFTPGAQPLTTLAAQLRHLAPGETMQHTLDQLAADERTLHLAVTYALAKRRQSDRALWVVDQFEEVFTHSRDEQERGQFLANLLYAVAVPSGRNLVVLTMRADFYPWCASYPQLAARLAAQQHLVSAMDELGLRQAIEEPARRVGLEFEPGLVETIQGDVARQPGALPLLQHALLELWERRRGRMLTLQGYRESGGVQGAIARRADVLYSAFSAEEQVIARRIMLRLTQPGEGTEDTRRRAVFSELVTRASERDAMERVIGALVEARLVTTSGEEQTGERWVDVAHEALIRSWPRLRQWIEEDRAALRVHRRLTEAAREWQRLGNDEGLLYRGTRLAEALEWQERHEAALNDLERGFLAASAALQQQERRARELQRRRVTLGLAIGLAAALLLSSFAGLQWQQAEEERRVAEAQRQVAVAREMAFQADAVRKGSAVLLPRSVLLAAETLRRFPSRETEPILRQGLALLSWPLASVAHDARVQAVAYSPDGHYLATGGADGTARVWEASSNREVARLSHDSAVQFVAWSPDGRYLASGSDDRTARLWEVAGGREVSRLVHDDRVYAVAFSPDGQLLATGSYDGSARLWEPRDGRALARLAHNAPVPVDRYTPDAGNQFAESTAQSISFSPDGRFLVTARSADHTARIWDVSSHRQVALLQHDDLVLSVAFSPQGRHVASGSVDGSARVWEAPGGRQVARVAIERGAPVFSVAFSPDGQHLAVGGRGSITRVAEATSGKEIASLWNDDTVQMVAWSPDGRHVATASNDRTARVWEPTGGREVARMPVETAGVVHAVAWSPDGRSLATASDEPTARVWEATKSWRVTGLVHDDNVIFVTFSPDGRYLATTAGDTARIWDAESGQELRRLPHDAIAWAIDFSSDSRYLATSSFDGLARVWEVASGQEAARFLHRRNVRLYGIRFSPDGRYLGITSQEGAVRVWEVVSGREVMQVAHDAAAGYPRFSFDGRLLATGSVDRTVRIWELASHREVRRMFHEFPVNDLALSPDGRLLAAGDDQMARVWELDSGRLVLQLPHDNAVNGVAFSPDGLYLATAARNGVARLWELAGGRQVAGMAHDKPMNGLAFSPDGRYLATASNDHTVRLWRPILEDPIAEACAHVIRNLTPQEWRQYLRDEQYGRTCPELP